MATCTDERAIANKELLSVNQVLDIFKERIAISSLKERLLDIAKENLIKKYLDVSE